MSGEVIEYHCRGANVGANTGVLETKSKNGITCTWSGQVVDGVDSIKYKWNFNWDELKKKGVEKLTGHIIARRPLLMDAVNVRIDVELTDCSSIIEKTIVNVNRSHTPYVSFDYYLTPIYTPKISSDEMFAATAKTDAVLVIEEKKLHVNKSFLSFHSDFFTALFSSNFKEGQMTEIPIKEVTYEDFGLLMSTIYPNTVFPNDKTSEKLLQLADRFLMPSVTHIAEHHLLEHSNIANEKLMWMADKYGMKNLLEKCIRSLDTVEKARQLEKCQEYKKLSDGAKAKISDRLAVLKTESQNGITCTWSGQLVDGDTSIKYKWNFNWDELKKKGVEKLTGHISAKRSYMTDAENDIIDVTLSDDCSIVEKTIFTVNLIREPEFLSFHSDFFTSLFSSNFKEGQMAEIPIKEVTYEDFGLLMSTIYPNMVFPNDESSEKLLELADRFLMPAVTREVEHHLTHISKLEVNKVLWMADAYKMARLLEKKTILSMDR